MPTEAQTLLEFARCYECYGALSLAQMLKLGIMAQIVLDADPMADVSPQNLFDLGSCYNCYGDGLSAADIMELALLSMIAANGTGGGGGGGQILEYLADPNAEGVTPTNQDAPAMAYAENNDGPTYAWDTDAHVWMT